MRYQLKVDIFTQKCIVFEVVYLFVRVRVYLKNKKVFLLDLEFLGFCFFSKSGNVFTFTEPFLKKKILPKKISWGPQKIFPRFFLAEFFFGPKVRCD